MAKQKFEAELGLNNKGFLEGLSEAEGGVGKFGKAVGALSLGIGAAAGAFKILIDWIKDTDFGLSAMNTTMAVSRQLLTDLISKNGLHLKEAVKNAQAQTKINEDNAKEGYLLANMNKELHDLTVKAADQTLTLAQKKEVLIKAMEKEHEIKQFLLKDAKEELRVAYDAYKLNPANTDARENYWKAATKVEDVQSMDSRRLMSQYTGVIAEQKQRASDLVKAFQTYEQDARDMFPGVSENIAILEGRLKDYQERLEEIDTTTLTGKHAFAVLSKAIEDLETKIKNFGKENIIKKLTGWATPEEALNEAQEYRDAIASIFGFADQKEGKTKLAAAPKKPQGFDNPNVLFNNFEVVDAWKAAWEDAIMGVADLMANTFTDLFEHIGSGSMEGFGNDLLKNFGSLVSQLGKMLVALGTTMFFAQTLLKTPSIPTALAAIAAGGVAMAIGGAMMGAANRGANSLSGGGSGGGNYSGNSSGTQTIKVEVQGKISGKDIALVSSRYGEDN